MKISEGIARDRRILFHSGGVIEAAFEMNTNDPLNDDQALRTVLKEWKVQAPLPPRFQAQVWRRIERNDTLARSEPSVWTLMRRWFAGALTRPALAAGCALFLLVAGAGFGWAQARHDSSRVSDELSLRYVKMMDPYVVSN